MIIVWGNYYLGKSEQVERTDTCEHCGRRSRLRSYTAREWFHLYYIPLIPLSTWRIMDHCSKCDMMRRMSVAQWQRVMRAVPEAVEAFLADPEDVEKLKKAMALATGHQDKEAFATLAEGAEKFFRDDMEVVALLGDGCNHFEDHEGEERARRRLVDLEDSAENRLLLAQALLNVEKNEEAEAILLPLPKEPEPTRVFLLHRLQAAYQKAGEREKVEELEEILKPLAGKKDRKSIARAAGAPVANWYDPLWVKLAIPAAILGMYLLIGVVYSSSRSVYVINGLGTPITYRIGEETRELGPKQCESVRVGAGLHEATMIKPKAEKEKPFTFAIPSCVWTWPGHLGETNVVNPDRLALLIWEEHMYRVVVRKDEKPEFKVHVNSGFYRFHNVDYPFKELPDEVEIEHGDSKAVDALSVYEKPDPPHELANIIFNLNGRGPTITWMERWLELHPEDNGMRTLLEQVRAQADG